MAQAFSPSATYGDSAVKNRVKPGGSLGSNQYFYITNASTGKIDVQRYEKSSDGVITTTSIGNIPQGGKFTPNSHASSAEKKHYNSSRELGKTRAQALQVARREWDGKTQPPPTQAIYGTDSGNVGYTPPGSSTKDTSIKGTQGTGYSTDINSNKSQRSNWNNIRDTAINAFFGKSGDAIVYPTTLRRSGNAQDYIQFDMLKYEPQKKDGYTWKDSRGSSADSRRQASIILPIPGGIGDSNAVTWGGDKMSPVETAMANLAITGIEKGFEEMGREAGGMVEQLKNNQGTKSAISKGIAGMASGTGAQLLTRTTGQIMNPNMELLFKDPTLRPFSFTWKLAARNKKEADDIIKIINIFKKGMAPQTSGDGLFLKSPHTWRITYKHRGRVHPYLNRFKECAMNSLTTQYTPDGNYATFETGHMTAYSITMGLQELSPIFSSDYKGIDGIGY